MVWLLLTALGLGAELVVIIELGQRATGRYEAELGMTQGTTQGRRSRDDGVVRDPGAPVRGRRPASASIRASCPDRSTWSGRAPTTRG